MGPIGFPEMFIIMLLVLLLFGPRKLPELGRTLGKGMAEFRKASNELKRTLNAEMIQEEVRQSAEVLRENDPRRMLRDVMNEAPEKVENEPAASEPGVAPSVETEASQTETPQAETSQTEASQTDASQPESPTGTIARSRGSSAPESSPDTPPTSS